MGYDIKTGKSLATLIEKLTVMKVRLVYDGRTTCYDENETDCGHSKTGYTKTGEIDRKTSYDDENTSEHV